MRIQRRLKISGRVQGVGFRASTARFAEQFTPRLRGSVRNLPDGSVEVVVQGEESEVNALMEWCRHGPPSANVTNVETAEEAPDASLPLFGVKR